MKISTSSKEYEKLAKRLYQDIVSKEGIDNIDVRHDAKIVGKSGVEHQIDVYWEFCYAGIKHKVLIECKHYSHKVNLLHVRNMYALTMDIPNSTGIILTTVGFQSGAEKYANFYEISLKVLRLPKTDDWNDGIQIVDIDITLFKNTYIDIIPSFDGNDEETKNVIEKNPSLMSLDISSIIIVEDDYDDSTLVQWLDRNTPITLENFDAELEHTIIPDSAYIKTHSGEHLKIGLVKVKYIASCMKQNIHIDQMLLVEAVLEDYASKAAEHMLPKT